MIKKLIRDILNEGNKISYLKFLINEPGATIIEFFNNMSKKNFKLLQYEYFNQSIIDIDYNIFNTKDIGYYPLKKIDKALDETKKFMDNIDKSIKKYHYPIESVLYSNFIKIKEFYDILIDIDKRVKKLKN